MITLKEKFKELKEKNKKAFIAYIPFGFPDIDTSKKIILSLEEVVDIIELGLPFSDPIADGPIIQEAYNIALKNNANIEKLFYIFKNLNIKIPIVLMSYYNPIFRFGLEKFFGDLSSVGISGVLVVDLPFDEDRGYLKVAKKFGTETVFLITPTTTQERAKEIIKNTGGFIYYVSVTGITGPKRLEFTLLKEHIAKLKDITDLPICVGFGIHTREQIKEINRFSDGVVVGSSIVKFIKQNFFKKNFIDELKKYIFYLKS